MSDSFRQGSGSGGARATWIGLLWSTCLCASCLERETFRGHGDFPHLLSLQRKFNPVHAWRLDLSQSVVYAQVWQYGMVLFLYFILSNILLFLLTNTFSLFFLVVHSYPAHSLMCSHSFWLLYCDGGFWHFFRKAVWRILSLLVQRLLRLPSAPGVEEYWELRISWGVLLGFCRGLHATGGLLGGMWLVLPENTHMLAHRLAFNVEVLERNVPCVCGVLVKAVWWCVTKE